METGQMAASITRRRFTVDEYTKLGEAGILRDERVELLDGEIVQMSPIGIPHGSTVMHLTRLLSERLGRRALLLVQGPVRLDSFSEPEPDLALLQDREDVYSSRKPGPADVRLLIEVAASSSEYDCTVKARLYAKAGISEMWILLLDSQTVRVLRNPGPDGYGDVTEHKGRDTLSPLAFPDQAFAAADLFPPLPKVQP